MLSRTHRLRTTCLVAFVGVLGCGSSESNPTTGSPSAGNGGAPASSGGAGGTSGSGVAGSGGTSGSGGLGGASTMLSYARDVQPLFHPCVYCHYTGSILVDIERAFEPTTGVVNANNSWATAHPEGNTPAKD